MLSKNHKLSNVVADIDDFKALINSKSHLIDNFMSDCTFWNSSTEDIKPVLWNSNHKILTFFSNTSLLNSDVIVKCI